MGSIDQWIKEKDGWLGFSGVALSLLQFIFPGGLLAASGAILSYFIFLKGITQREAILLAVIVFLVLAIASRVIWRRVSWKAYHYPNSKIKSNYTVIEKTITYKLEDKADGKSVAYSRSMTIKPTVHHLQSITGKFLWTGSSKPRFPSDAKIIDGISEFTTYGERIGIWNYYGICFDPELTKGEKHHLAYAWPPLRDYETSSPFIAASTEEPTKKLTYIVDLGSDYANAEYQVEELQSMEGGMTLKTSKGHFDQNGRVEWSPKKIKRFRYYRFRWSWSSNKAPFSVPEDDDACN